MRRWAGFFFVLSAVALTAGWFARDGDQPLEEPTGATATVVSDPGLSSATGYFVAAGMSAAIGLTLVVLRARGDQQGNAVQNRRQAKR